MFFLDPESEYVAEIFGQPEQPFCTRREESDKDVPGEQGGLLREEQRRISSR